MNAILHRDPTVFQDTRQLTHGMLCLRSGQTVTRNEDHFVRIRQLNSDVINTDFAHLALRALAHGHGRGAAEGAKQNVCERTIHRPAHQDRKNESRESVERARYDQHVIRKHEAGCRRG